MSNSNRLLLALPIRNLKQLVPELEHISCRRDQVLMDADSSLDHVYFPDSGVVSVVAVYANGSVIEMATIGREGCTGSCGDTDPDNATTLCWRRSNRPASRRSIRRLNSNRFRTLGQCHRCLSIHLGRQCN
jgi:CRP-like cAMP-binding protein